MEQILLGQILLNLNLVSESQLDHCVRLQEQLAIHKPLGEILVEQGVLDKKSLASILNVQHRRQVVGRAQRASKEAIIEQRLKEAPIAEYLKLAKEHGASDLYLTSGMKPSLRINGNLVDLAIGPLAVPECRSLIFSLLSQEDVARYFTEKSVHANLDVPEVGRVRMSVFRHYGGIAAVIRFIADAIPRIAELGLPPVVTEFVHLHHGLVLVTGSTGSGKTTTLSALIDLINKNRQVHVIMLEDPVEVIFRSERALITQRDVSKHSLSFHNALTAALREDPDVIVVGELRDPETTATALTAAETGHLVFATLHTRNSYSTVHRLVDQFPAQKHDHVRAMLASALRAVVSQELLPSVDGQRRHLAAETMVVNQAIAHLIRENRTWQIPMVMQMSANEGMVLMDDALVRLVEEKKVTLDEALSRANDKTKFLVRNS